MFKGKAHLLLASIIVVSASVAVAGTGNLIPNGDFEVGCGFGMGTSMQDRDYSLFNMWDTTQAHHGKASMKIPVFGNLITRAIPITPDKKYTVSVWVKPTAMPASIKLAVYNDSKDLAAMASGRPAPRPGVASTQPIGTRVENTFNLKEGWQQVTISGQLEAFPTSDYHVRVMVLGSAVWIDQLQLAEGAVVDFKPRIPLEVGLTCDKASHIFVEGEKVAMPLLAHNGTAKDISAKIGYDVFDFLNRKVKSGSVAAEVPAGKTWEGSLDLEPGARGMFRVVLWVEGQDGSDEEVAFSVVAKPKVKGPDPTSLIGIHASGSVKVLEAMQKLGIKWQRALSPAAWLRWELVEKEKGKFTWFDKPIKKTVDSGMQILGCIHGWAPWAEKNDLDAWENFVTAAVEHHKDSIHVWEICNEPIYEYKDPKQYCEVLKRASRAIRKADPKAKIVGMGGSYDVKWHLAVIEGLGGKPKEYMDLISTHLYPPGADPLNPSHDTRGLEYREKIITPYEIDVWNTETGPWCAGIYQGPNSSYRYLESKGQGNRSSDVFFRGFNYEAERTIYNFMHTVGNGMTGYYYYDARLMQGPDYYKTHCSILQHDDSLRTKGVAYGVLAWLFDHSKGLGNITAVPKTREEFRAATSNPAEHEVGDMGSDVKVYAYLFDRGGVPLLAIWSSDTKNRTLTVGLDAGSIKSYDMMGNEMKLAGGVIPFGRSPIYLEGQGKLTVEQLKTAVSKGKLAEVADKTPPNLTISEAPRGQTDSSSIRVRWIGIDETSVPALAKANAGDLSAVSYSYRLVGRDKDWSNWAPKTIAFYKDLTPGKYQLEIKAKDKAGNVCEPVVREFSVVKP